MKIVPTVNIAACLVLAVRTKLATEPQIANVVSVKADADKNEVTLSGTVTTQQTRQQAVALANAAQPGMVVVDNIDVKPREVSRSDYTEEMAREVRNKAKASGQKIGDSLDDAWIHTKTL